LHVPWYGLPVADISLASDAPLATAVTLKVGNLSLSMTAIRSRAFAGVRYARLVGGAGGWATKVTMTPLRNAAGVLLSTALRDLAALAIGPGGASETVKLASDKVLGGFFVPETGASAGRILGGLAAPLWWIDATGVTQVAATRPAKTIATQANVEWLDGRKGLAGVATEDVASWLPGATFTGPTVPTGLTIRDTLITSGDDGVMRVEVMTA
jgi:hypothetical protein